MLSLKSAAAAILGGCLLFFEPGIEPDPVPPTDSEIVVQRGNSFAPTNPADPNLASSLLLWLSQVANSKPSLADPPDPTDRSSPAPQQDDAPFDEIEFVIPKEGVPLGECSWREVIDPTPSTAGLQGNDPNAGTLYVNYCNGGDEPLYRSVSNAAPGVPAPPPPPDPAALAREALGQLQIPKPSIGAGPDRSKLAVNLWTWLWVDDPGQLSVTVAAGTVSVTATATLTSVTWTLGEPAAQGDTYQRGTPATITCQGAGTPPPPTFDWKAEPPCGHQFHWRSLKERTGGTGTWPITATTNWTVTWQSNTGVTGGTTLNATTNDQFDIGEYRIVLVQGPGG